MAKEEKFPADPAKDFRKANKSQDEKDVRSLAPLLHWEEPTKK